MNILFDASPIAGQKSGVGHFSQRLLESMAKGDDQITAYYFNFIGKNKIPPLPTSKNIAYKEIRFMPSKLISVLNRLGVQLPIELFVGFKKFDFAIFPNFVNYPSIRKLESFTAIHDLSFIDCPEYTQNANKNFLQKFVPKSIKRSSGILTISDFSKKRIQEYYNVKKDNILVLPIPYEDKKSIGSISESIRSIAKRKYFLYVGTIEPRKNITGLINGFVKLPPNIRKEYALVLAGAIGWKTESTMRAIKENKDIINCKITGYVNDAERNFLYKNSNAVCLLSHYEGFGMPILEAAHYKKPLVLNSIEVLKEVAGPNAYYCDANNPNDVARALKKSITDKTPSLVNKEYSWNKNMVRLDKFIQNKLQGAKL